MEKNTKNTWELVSLPSLIPLFCDNLINLKTFFPLMLLCNSLILLDLLFTINVSITNRFVFYFGVFLLVFIFVHVRGAFLEPTCQPKNHEQRKLFLLVVLLKYIFLLPFLFRIGVNILYFHFLSSKNIRGLTFGSQQDLSQREKHSAFEKGPARIEKSGP